MARVSRIDRSRIMPLAPLFKPIRRVGRGSPGLLAPRKPPTREPLRLRYVIYCDSR